MQRGLSSYMCRESIIIYMQGGSIIIYMQGIYRHIYGPKQHCVKVHRSKYAGGVYHHIYAGGVYHHIYAGGSIIRRKEGRRRRSTRVHRDLCYHGQCRRRTAGTVYSSAEDFELDYARASSLEREEIIIYVQGIYHHIYAGRVYHHICAGDLSSYIWT